jgi:Flp pilus assembly protein protease CpaA
MSDLGMSGPQWALFAALTLLAFFADWKYRQVFNWITYPAFLAGLLWAAAESWFWGTGVYWWAPLFWSGAGAFLAFVLTILVWLQGGLGGADVKLLTAAGAIVRCPFIIELLMYAVLVGLAAGLCAVIWEGKFKELMKRLLSFRKLLKKQTVEESVKPVPFGMAFAGGALWACLMHVKW